MFKFLNSIIFGKPKEDIKEIKEINKDMKVRISDKGENENFNQTLHSCSETIKGRAGKFYTEEEIKKMIKEVG